MGRTANPNGLRKMRDAKLDLLKIAAMELLDGEADDAQALDAVREYARAERDVEDSVGRGIRAAR
jgi:hypothetical protein